MEKLSNSYRESSLEKTWELLEQNLKTVGITRIADITGLDTVGIPVYQAVRPESAYPISVFAGKGMTPLESKVSACMEALESYVVERYKPKMLSGCFETLKNERQPVVDPCHFILPAHIKREGVLFDWVQISAFHGQAVYVPKEIVLMPCPNRLWSSNTNGIASGNSLAEALVHAILEVIERDAQSLALVSREARKTGSDLLRGEKIDLLIQAIRSAGLEIFIKDITSNLGVPTFYTLLRDPSLESPWYCSGGTGAHVNPFIAVSRSITEAVQARTCMIAGAREDLHKEKAKETVSYEKFKNVFEYWFSDRGMDSIEYSSPHFEDVEGVLKYLVSILKERGFTVYWVDYSLDVLPFKVVRAIIPGLECFAVSKTRIGKRLIHKEPRLKQLLFARKEVAYD